MKRDLNLLTSPGFVAGLLLLLANDFLLKPVFHNAATGKLSDFSGLFVFPLFWSALAPRLRREIYALAALGFVFWKSVYAQPLIDGWNSLGVLRVDRVVDPTDLVALVALPASFAYLRRHVAAERRPWPLAPRRALACAALLLSVFAFAATSRVGDHMISEDREYEFGVSREELLRRLHRDADVENISRYRFDDEYVKQSEKAFGQKWTEEDRHQFSLRTRTRVCDEGVYAAFTLHSRGEGSLLKVAYLIYNCVDAPPEAKAQLEAEAVRAFERDVVEKLRAPAGGGP
ncbi:MAG: hypothetical protein ABW208_02735 [Pyrinomonadaceae bacterium]